MVQFSEQLSLSPIAQGFWRLGLWDWTTEQLVAFIHGCIQRSVTTFDTAEIYSATLCETLMGQAFHADPSLRNQIQLVSKTGIFKREANGAKTAYYDTSYERIMTSCKESLQRLQTDHLDLYLIHRPDPFMDFAETARALKELKQQGLILEAGVSNFNPVQFHALNQAMDGTLVTNQIEWNPVCFEHFNSGMMDQLTVSRIHPMIWSPLAGGRLFCQEDPLCIQAMEKIRKIAKRHQAEPAAIVYAWLLQHPVGAVVLSGSNQLSRLDTALQGQSITLERWEWYEIYTASGQQVLR